MTFFHKIYCIQQQFQGKRALFEAGNIGPIPGVKRETSSMNKYQEINRINFSDKDVDIMDDRITKLEMLEEKNRRLEQDLVKLEQVASAKEDIGRRMSEKVDKLESLMADMEKNLDKLQHENSQKEDIIQSVSIVIFALCF